MSQNQNQNPNDPSAQSLVQILSQVWNGMQNAKQPAPAPVAPAPMPKVTTAADLPKVKEKKMRRTLALTPQEFETKLGIGMINPGTLRQLLDSKKSMPEVMEKVVNLMLDTMLLWKEYYNTNQHLRFNSWGASQQKSPAPSNISQYDAETILRRVLRRHDVPTAAILKCMEYRATHGGAYRWENVLFRNRSIPEEIFRARLVKKNIFKNGNNSWQDGLRYGNLDLELLENPACPTDLVKIFEEEVIRLSPHDIYDGPAGNALEHLLRRDSISEETLMKFAAAAPFVIISSPAVTPNVLNLIVNKTTLAADVRTQALWKLHNLHCLQFVPPTKEEKQDVTQNTTAEETN